MPKLPNLANPVAAIRHRLGMSIDQFAEFLGHGKAMLKQVEAGLKPASEELRMKIQKATGIELDSSPRQVERLTDKTLLAGPDVPAARTAHELIGDDRLANNRYTLTLVPEILALFFSMLEANVNPHLATIALRREMSDTLKRWGVDRKKFDSMKDEFGFLVFRPRDGLPSAADVMVDAIASAGPFRRAAARRKAWIDREEKAARIRAEERAKAQGLKRVERRTKRGPAS